MEKIKFNHEEKNPIFALGYNKVELARADEPINEYIEKIEGILTKNIPTILDNHEPGSDGFNEEIAKLVPTGVQIADDIQEVLLKAGFQPSMELGFILHSTTNFVIESASTGLQSVVQMETLKRMSRDSQQSAELKVEK